MAERFKIEGVAELRAALADLCEAVATKVGAKADRDAANVLKDALVSRAPFDPNAKSPYGHLRDNIRVRKAKARNEHIISYNVTVGDAFWGRFLEFGTVKMPAKPWMRPTFDTIAEGLITVQIDGLRDGIEREAQRAARAAGMKTK